MEVAPRRSSFVHFRHRNIPDRELLRDPRRVARETGRRLFAEHGAYGRNTFTHRFGSGSKALDAVVEVL